LAHVIIIRVIQLLPGKRTGRLLLQGERMLLLLLWENNLLLLLMKRKLLQLQRERILVLLLREKKLLLLRLWEGNLLLHLQKHLLLLILLLLKQPILFQDCLLLRQQLLRLLHSQNYWCCSRRMKRIMFGFNHVHDCSLHTLLSWRAPCAGFGHTISRAHSRKSIAALPPSAGAGVIERAAGLVAIGPEVAGNRSQSEGICL
jgi:hypothetical protein